MGAEHFQKRKRTPALYANETKYVHVVPPAVRQGIPGRYEREYYTLEKNNRVLGEIICARINFSDFSRFLRFQGITKLRDIPKRNTAVPP